MTKGNVMKLNKRIKGFLKNTAYSILGGIGFFWGLICFCSVPMAILFIIWYLLSASPRIAHAGNLDLLYGGSNVQGVKSHTADIGFSDKISDKIGISGYYRNGKTDGVVTQDEGEIDLQYNPKINDKWSLWLDERIGYNKVLGIDYENDLGVGLKYYLFQSMDTKLSLSSGILYQYTPEEDHGRYSHRVKFSSNDIVSVVYFYQPDINDSSDYITKLNCDVRLAKIKDNISILLNYKNDYRSTSGLSESTGIKLRFEY